MVEEWSASDGYVAAGTTSGDFEDHWTWVLPANMETGHEWARIGIAALVSERLRDGGLSVVPMANTVERFAQEHYSAAQLPALRSNLGTTMVILPHAYRSDGNWNVDLFYADSTSQGRVHAISSDLYVAGQLASDRLLAETKRGVVTIGHEELLFRVIEQSIEARDFDGARAQLSHASAFSKSPAGRFLTIKVHAEEGNREKAEDLAARLRHEFDEGKFNSEHDARILGRLGLIEIWLKRQRGESPESLEPLVKSTVLLLSSQGDEQEQAQAFFLRGTMSAIQGMYEQAGSNFTRARELFLAGADELGAARALMSLAQSSAQLNRKREAIEQLEISFQEFSRYSSVSGQFRALRAMLSIQISTLQWQDASTTITRLGKLKPHPVSATEKIQRLRGEALVMLGLGRLQEAETLLAEIAEHLHEANAEAIRTNELYWLQLRFSQGRYAEAANQSEKLFESLTSHSNDSSRPSIEQRDLALLIWLESRFKLRHAASQSNLLPINPAPTPEPTTMSDFYCLAIAYLLAERGSERESEAQFSACFQAAQQANALSRAARAAEGLTSLLLEQGRADDAAIILDSLKSMDPDAIGRDYSIALLDARVKHAQSDLKAWTRAVSVVHRLAGERKIPASLLHPPPTHHR